MSYIDILPNPSIFKIYDTYGNEIVKLYQWDINVKVCIKEWNITENVLCYFYQKDSNTTLAVTPTIITEEDDTKTLTCEIPNKLLQKSKEINFYLVLSQNNELLTQYQKKLEVAARPQPEGYTPTDNTDYVILEELQQEVNKLIDYIHTAIDDGKLHGPEGPIGPQGPQGPRGIQGPIGTSDYNDLLNAPIKPLTTSEQIVESSNIESGNYIVRNNFTLKFNDSNSIDIKTNDILNISQIENNEINNACRGILFNGNTIDSDKNGVTLFGYYNNFGWLVGDPLYELAAIDTIYRRKSTRLIVYDNTTITLQDNTEYIGNNINRLTLVYPNSDFECSIMLTFANEGNISITLPTSQYIGAVPLFSNGTTWELSIKNGIVVGGEVI